MPLKAIDTHPLTEGLSRVESMRRSLGASDEDLLADYVEDACDALTKARAKAEFLERPELQKVIGLGLRANQQILVALKGEA